MEAGRRGGALASGRHHAIRPSSDRPIEDGQADLALLVKAPVQTKQLVYNTCATMLATMICVFFRSDDYGVWCLA
jgi:hypothetical protein